MCTLIDRRGDVATSYKAWYSHGQLRGQFIANRNQNPNDAYFPRGTYTIYSETGIKRREYKDFYPHIQSIDTYEPYDVFKAYY